MKLKNSGRKKWLFSTAMILIGILFVYRIFHGAILADEAFNLSESYRIIQGSKFLVDIWDNYQTGDLFFALPMALYKIITGGLDGIVLFARLFYLCINAIIAGFTYVVFKKLFGERGAIAGAIAVILYAPFSLYYLWYDTCGLLFFYIGILFIIYGNEKPICYLFAGVFHAFMALAYPSFVVVIIYEVVIMIGIMKVSKKNLIYYMIGGISIVIIFILYCISVGVQNIYLLDPDIKLGTQLIANSHEAIVKIANSIKDSFAMLKRIIVLMIILLGLLEYSIRKHWKILQYICIFGITILPFFNERIHNRNVIYYYFYWAILGGYFAICLRKIVNEVITINLIIPSALMMLLVGYTALYGGDKAAIGTFGASICGISLYIYYLEKKTEASKLVLDSVIILFSIIAVYFYWSQSFLSDELAVEQTIKVENGVFSGIYVSDSMEKYLEIEEQIHDIIKEDDDTIAFFDSDLMYGYLASGLKPQISSLVRPYQQREDGTLDWSLTEKYWDKFGAPDLIILKTDSVHYAEAAIYDILNVKYTKVYESEYIYGFRKNQ